MLSPDSVLQNRYRVIRQLGKGGMGTVYEAIDQRFDSQVAIKETHFAEDALRKQFEREARLLNRLRHSALTRVIDHFSEGDGQFLVMDFIAGHDLWELLETRGEAFPVEEVLRWADQLLDALDYLHKQNPPIIHRDIKPQNLKLSHPGQVILLDFGLAKGFAGQISRVTTAGSIFGYTPNYAPLEQIQGAGTDGRSDLYSLGATLYHLMTAVKPPDVLTRLTATTDGQPDPLRPADEVNDAVPSGVAKVLSTAMAIGRTQRPGNATEMRRALSEVTLKRPLAKETPPQDSLPLTLDEGSVKPADKVPLTPTIASDQTRPSEHPVVSETTAAVEMIPTLRVAPPVPPNSTTLVQSSPKSNFLLWMAVSIVGLVLISGLIGFLAISGTFSNRTAPQSVTGGNTDSFRIGVYASLSGQLSSFGSSSVNGIRMAADEINKAGGVNGRQIEILVEDDEGSPERAATVVSKLISQDKVQALLGEVTSSNTLAAAPKAQEAKVPMITPLATYPKVTEVGDYVFRACFVDPFQGAAMAQFAHDSLGARNAAILYDRDSIYSKSLVQSFKHTLTRLGGEIVIEQAYGQRESNFISQLTAIRDLNPDVIYVPGYYQEVAVIAKQTKQLGIKATLLGGDGWDSPQVFEIGGDALNNSYITNHYAPDDPSPAVKRFTADYRVRFGSTPDAIAALSYDALKLIADSLTRAGTTEGQRLRDAVARTRGFQGVTGNITIDSERNAIKPVVILELRNGRFVYKESVQPR